MLFRSFQWKVTNTGSVPITSISWRRTWVDCSGFTNQLNPCGATFSWPTSTSWQGPLLPGQYILLPNGGSLTNQFANSWTSSAVCFNSTTCAIQPGGSNTMRVTILTVNGGTGDANLNNNQVDCTVNRLTTATNHDVDFIDVRSQSKLYENPIRYNSIDDAILEKIGRAHV